MSAHDERLADGLAGLQGAAVQLIAATRAFLDVAEELVKDPAAATTMVQSLASLATAARSEWARSQPPAAPADGAEPADEPAPGPRVRPIRLSDEG